MMCQNFLGVNIQIEKIEDGFRQKVELVPFDAFREAVANALVHRTWDIKTNKKIEMHPDKIIISSLLDWQQICQKKTTLMGIIPI